MYRFSRSIYREISPLIAEPPCGSNGVPPRQQVLDACEATIRRLAYDRRYFAKPARSLFNDVRAHFPIRHQLRVYNVINTYIDLAVEFMEKLPEDVLLDGQPRQCRASTRKGTPCQREPLPGRDYCPSHKHLEEIFEGVEEELAEPVGAAA